MSEFKDVRGNNCFIYCTEGQESARKMIKEAHPDVGTIKFSLEVYGASQVERITFKASCSLRRGSYSIVQAFQPDLIITLRGFETAITWGILAKLLIEEIERVNKGIDESIKAEDIVKLDGILQRFVRECDILGDYKILKLEHNYKGELLLLFKDFDSPGQVFPYQNLGYPKTLVEALESIFEECSYKNPRTVGKGILYPLHDFLKDELEKIEGSEED
jgi:hypothetical protein